MLIDGLKPRHLVTVTAAATLVSFVLWHLVTRTGRLLPSPAWVTALVMVVLAVLVLWAGWQVRRFQLGRRDKDFTPLRAARALRLAQAGSLTGAAIAGWFLGHLAVLLPDRDLTPYGRQVLPLLALIAAGFLLAAAGLVAQQWCRLPEDRDDPPGTLGAPGSTPGRDS